MKRFWAALSVAVLPLAVATTAVAGPAYGSPVPAMYDGVSLGTLGGEGSLVFAMNDRDEVVGLSATEDEITHPFLWRNGTMLDLGLPPGTVSGFATDINDRGQVIGVASIAAGGWLSWIWDGGAMAPLDIPGGWTFAFALNNRGQVAGTYLSGDRTHGFVWQDGSLTDLGVLDVTDINDRGQVVGYGTDDLGRTGGYLWDHGRLTYLDMSPQAINDSGWVVGVVVLPGSSCHSALWRAGEMTLLPDLGGGFSRPVAINDRGDVLGRSAATDGKEHGYLWRNGRTYDLEERGIEIQMVPQQATTGTVDDLNNRGHIAATLAVEPPYYFDQHAYLYR